LETAKYVFLGGGMVAGYAVKEMVKHGGSVNGLIILSSDDALPYERPPLSKGLLTGKDKEESIFINPSGFYSEHAIDVRLNTTVTEVDFSSKRIVLGGGEQIVFEKLALATGAQPRKLDTDGVLYLRSLDDSRRIKDGAASAKRALVIGGGFIAMEAASSLAQRGVEVTMAIRADRISKSFFTEEMSTSFQKYYESRGVRLELSADRTRFKQSEYDMVVGGIGVTPVTEIFKGIMLGNGVHVNEYLETSVPDVYAAGDVANYHDVLFRKQRRVEHWDNAVSQGKHVAHTLLGERKPFVHVPYFFSDIFDLSYEFWGDTTGAINTVYRGDVNSTSFSAWWLDETNRLLAAFAMNRPDEEREAAPQWIEHKRDVSPERLADTARALTDALESRS
jgi:NADPH-dependent 2,4-dienoyl-CoA reductase/sulfur reductase-like enzyme